jgi:hypothetical protein
MSVMLHTRCQIQQATTSLRNVNCGPAHIQCTYSSAYSDFNIHLNVSALVFEISRQFTARYTTNIEPNIAHIVRFTLCGLWSRTYTMYLQHGYSGFNIQLIVSALLLEISRLSNARYTAKLVPNTAHILQFTPRDLWSRPYTKYLQLRMFRLQYSTVGICAAIVDITSVLCALCCKLGAKCRAHPPAFAL